MSGKLITLIYFYVISAAALALIVIGIFSTVNFLINITQYDKYPLQYLGEDCENFGTSYSKGPYPMELESRVATPTAEEERKLKAQCEKRVEQERKQRKVDDIRNSITFSLVGVILFLIHYPQARKHASK